MSVFTFSTYEKVLVLYEKSLSEFLFLNGFYENVYLPGICGHDKSQ